MDFELGIMIFISSFVYGIWVGELLEHKRENMKREEKIDKSEKNN